MLDTRILDTSVLEFSTWARVSNMREQGPPRASPGLRLHGALGGSKYRPWRGRRIKKKRPQIKQNLAMAASGGPALAAHKPKNCRTGAECAVTFKSRAQLALTSPAQS